VSGQLSNQAIKEGIDALWPLTRENVPTTSLERASLDESGPAPRTPKRVLRRLAPNQIEELIQGYVEGVPADELAAKFDVDQSTVQKHARRHGVPHRSTRLGPVQTEEAARLYLAGQSLAKLSDHFGVATDTVALALRRAGVALRPRRGWPRWQ
jgi:DNA-directed RNA polymerase specialized sigma24 family protein